MDARRPGMLLEIQDNAVNSALYFVLTYESRVDASAPPLLNVRRTDPASFQRVKIRNQQIKIQLENAVIIRDRKQSAVKNLLRPSQRIYAPGAVDSRSDDSVRHSKIVPSVQTSPALVLRREPPSLFSGRPPSGGTARNRLAPDRGSWASAPGFPRTRPAYPCKDGFSL